MERKKLTGQKIRDLDRGDEKGIMSKCPGGQNILHDSNEGIYTRNYFVKVKISDIKYMNETTQNVLIWLAITPLKIT